MTTALEHCAHPLVKYAKGIGVYRCPDCRHFHFPGDEHWLAERPERTLEPTPQCNHQRRLQICGNALLRCLDCGMIESSKGWKVP